MKTIKGNPTFNFSVKPWAAKFQGRLRIRFEVWHHPILYVC